jgi:GNAT superfamily N-acetyltransferase
MPVAYRPVEDRDVGAMAVIRAKEWGTEAFWKTRIGLYLAGKHSPQQALPLRAAFVAVDDGVVVGFVAGHRTQRHGCEGEVQWINVVEERRGHGIAGKLLETMADWFANQKLGRICVNVDSSNVAARRFYARYGGKPLNDHWIVWEEARAIRAQLKPSE